MKNVGGVDKIVRIIAGVALIAYGIIAQNWLGAIGVVPLGTALLGVCPAYLPFGISTNKDKK